jgi:hypothetical protein
MLTESHDQRISESGRDRMATGRSEPDIAGHGKEGAVTRAQRWGSSQGTGCGEQERRQLCRTDGCIH